MKTWGILGLAVAMLVVGVGIGLGVSAWPTLRGPDWSAFLGAPQLWGPVIGAALAIAGVVITVRTTDARADKDREQARTLAQEDRDQAERRAAEARQDAERDREEARTRAEEDRAESERRATAARDAANADREAAERRANADREAARDLAREEREAATARETARAEGARATWLRAERHRLYADYLAAADRVANAETDEEQRRTALRMADLWAAVQLLVERKDLLDAGKAMQSKALRLAETRRERTEAEYRAARYDYLQAARAEIGVLPVEGAEGAEYEFEDRWSAEE